MLEVELLYFDGCPSWERAWAELGRALVELDLSACMRLRNIAELSDAQKAGFGGSPTIRVEGCDLEGYAGPPVTACRRYSDNNGHGWPSQTLLRRKLLAAGAPAAHREAAPATRTGS